MISNEIFDNLNRIHDAKNSGVLTDEEFAAAIVNVGKLFANLVQSGKLNTADEDIDEIVSSFEEWIPKNSNYFNHKHSNLDSAYKKVSEQNTAALLALNERIDRARPVTKVYTGM